MTTRSAITIQNTPKRNLPVPQVMVDESRDALLTAFGKATMDDRYLTENESYQDRFANCVRYYSNDDAHAQRMYDYISKLWCMPATPILSNGGTIKGNLISCFVNEVPDSLEGIIGKWVENSWMGAKGGGTGSYYGNVRAMGEDAGTGKTSGAMSFVKVNDSLVACISQGLNRKGAGAIYMDIFHPEIEPFLDMRRVAGGDPDRKALNLHHGVCIPDAFYAACDADADWNLISPKTGEVVDTVNARELFQKLVITRLETGEPYIINIDHVNRAMPEHQRKSGLKVRTSNLCVAPETRLLTRHGYKPIQTLAGTSQDVWNGTEWTAAYVEKTGENQKLITVALSNGVELNVTPYHRFKVHSGDDHVIVEAQDLTGGDKLVKMELPVVEEGFALNAQIAYDNGFFSSANATDVPIGGNQDARLHWLAGYLDRSGRVVTTCGVESLRVSATSKEFLLEVRLLLTTLGIATEVIRNEVRSSSDLYRLTITARDTQKLLEMDIPLDKLVVLKKEISKFFDPFVTVVDVVDDGRTDDTYCFNEPIEHMGVFEGVPTMNCAEITLPTGIDQHGIDRTAICCLFQMNADKFDEWKSHPLILEDVAYFLDNVLQDFIDEGGEHFTAARYSANQERSIGVGVMGFHSFLQSKNIPIESAMAKVWNKKIFTHVRAGMDAASVKLAHERGACPDAAEHGVMERFSCKMAEAPTASVSIICGTTSPGIDPIVANIFIQKTLDGSFEVRNSYLEKLLEEKGMNTEAVWDQILADQGSVQHLDFLSQDEKDVYKTSFELDQRWLVELAADRTPSICQSQSLNLFIPPDVHKYDLLQLHLLAHRLGVKSLYYLRSYSLQEVGSADGSTTASAKIEKEHVRVDYEECLSCT